MLECLALDSEKLNNELAEKFKVFSLIESVQSTVGNLALDSVQLDKRNS